MLTVDDFPLTALGPLIYARTKSSPILTATDPAVAMQITTALNVQAENERPGDIGAPWLVKH